MQKAKRYTEKIVSTENQVMTTKFFIGMAMTEMAMMIRVTMAMEKIFLCLR